MPEYRQETLRVHSKGKRKLKISHEEQKVCKISRVNASKVKRHQVKDIINYEHSSEHERGQFGRNLHLILSLQSKDIDIERKVNLAYDFVNTSAEGGFEAVSISSSIVFLNYWIQSLLISSEKKVRICGDETRSKVSNSSLDFQYWYILKFCVEESLKLQVSLRFSHNLLQSIRCVLKYALLVLNKEPTCSRKTLFTGQGFEVYSIALDCVSQIFKSHGGMLNANLDLWILTNDSVLEALQKIYADNLDEGSSYIFFMQFSCVLLEPFSEFLRVHPCRKNGFQDFIDKILERLLYLLGVLDLRIDVNDSRLERNLLSLIKEVISYGLFHPSHIDGFLGLRSMEKYIRSDDIKEPVAKTAIMSYHRHLFDRMEKFMASRKKLSPLGGLGELFHLFVDQVQCQIRVPLLCEGSKMVGKGDSSKLLEEDNQSEASKTSSYTSFNAATRKGVFEFFVKIMEPLLQEITDYVQGNLDIEDPLFSVHWTLKSTNKLLASFMRENVYMRMEDTSERAYRNFLKVAYDTIMSLSPKITQICLSSFDVGKVEHIQLIKLVATEVIISAKYFLEIEYDVFGNDLANLWHMMLSYLAYDSLMDIPDQSSLPTEVLDLACQLINLYSELRQVNIIIFTLCKAVRLLIPCERSSEMNSSGLTRFRPFRSHETYSKSVGLLLSSQNSRLSIYNAIKSIPEGQAGGYIDQLTDDISETLEWLKASNKLRVRNDSSFDLDPKSDLLGRILSEMYTLVLESLIVTGGNSNAVRVSIERLMTKIRPSMSSLVIQQPENASLNLNEFIFSITGRTSMSGEISVPKFGTSTCWIIILFFRLYTSCRSLYRQAMCLVLPNVSKMMASSIGDLCTMYREEDFMEKPDYVDDSYFFWISHPSASLLTILHSIFDNYLQGDTEDFSPLIYVMYTMIIQRLVDLNRQIKSFEFLLQKNDKVMQMLMDDDGLLLSSKKIKTLNKALSIFRKESTGLTAFMMRYLPLVDRKESSISTADDVTDNSIHDCSWDLMVCTVNIKTFPTTFWWIICNSVDVWGAHAEKKMLKMFLSLLICNSICSLRKNHVGVVGSEKITKTEHLRNTTIYHISLELLKDTVLYDQRFVCRYFASAFCRVLKKSILRIFCKFSGDVDFNSSPDWQNVISALDHPSSVIVGKEFFEEKAFPVISMEIKRSQSLLNLLCWMPKGYSSSKSFSLYATYILNLERLGIRSLLDHSFALHLDNVHDLVKLLVSCRKALKYLAVASCEKLKSDQSSLFLILFQDPSSILWLLKSVYAVEIFRHVPNVNELIFSLIDHTSYVFLTLNKCQFRLTMDSFFHTEKPCKVDFDSSGYIDTWKSILLVSRILKEEMKRLLIPVKNYLKNNVADLTKLSSILSCFQGFVWGLVSALNEMETKSGIPKRKLYRWKPISDLSICIDEFADSVYLLTCMLVFEDNQWPEKLFGVPNKVLHSENADRVATALAQYNSFQSQWLNLPFLRSLLKGENPEAAFLLRQLFIASASISRFRFLINCTPLSSSLVPTLVSASRFLLHELSPIEDFPRPFLFVQLDGVVIFLKELSRHFTAIDHVSSENMYVELIGLHLSAIGKLISLQGKEATLGSHETESSTKKLDNGLDELHRTCYLDEFKNRLRASFKEFIKNASELHLTSAVQVLERALVGVQEDCMMFYQINTRRISSFVAAGIDCLDLVLETVSGRKQLNVIRTPIQSFVGALFNIILHLNRPLIFHAKTVHNNKSSTDPDSGSVILMSVEVLTRVFGKPALFHMESCHIAESLRIPAMLFQSLLHFRPLKTRTSSNFSLILNNCDSETVASETSYAVDRKFSIYLYAACCRLLYTVLKHHKRDCEPCVALLQDSASVLLLCLERENPELVIGEGFFSWELQEGITCASSLRRIYEEIRQQKDVYGRHSFKFLSSFIWVYSGCGPLQTGIARGIDEALRQGIYALIDACSEDDLQRLHTIFGEGPCRNTLSLLQHDYKLNFQYEGKV